MVILDIGQVALAAAQAVHIGDAHGGDCQVAVQCLPGVGYREENQLWASAEVNFASLRGRQNKVLSWLCINGRKERGLSAVVVVQSIYCKLLSGIPQGYLLVPLFFSDMPCGLKRNVEIFIDVTEIPTGTQSPRVIVIRRS